MWLALRQVGREGYLERMWEFMNNTRGVISTQHRRLGVSADWSRERFTMDEVSARAVRTAFKRLWDAGLVYRGEALVNWCPRCRTTISDLENLHREEIGTLWTIRYHLAAADASPDPDRWIGVATTRPETLLGDTAVAVHPDDERYRDLVGRQAVLPFLGRLLPIVADEAVEPEFGTGAVKVTPAHDPDDHQLALRHGLPMINVMDEEARIGEAGGEFAGLDRYEARARIVDRLRSFYAWPDRLAVYYSDLYRSAFVVTYILAGAAVGVAQVAASGQRSGHRQSSRKLGVGWLSANRARSGPWGRRHRENENLVGCRGRRGCRDRVVLRLRVPAH